MYHPPANPVFPQQHLPLQLREVVKAISSKTQAPVELIVSTCLSAMSLASQALVMFQYSNGRVSPVSLYNVVIAESGERKTAVFNQVMKPILEFEREALKAYSEQNKVYEADLQAWKAINKSILKKIRKNEEQEEDNTSEKNRLREHYTKMPEPPRLPKLLYNDATYEAIVKGLSENIGSAGLVSDEGGGILNGRAMNNSPLFNQLWDGGSVDIERKNHRMIIDNSRFIILIMTQLNEFNNFIKKRGERTLGNGFFARCLWSVTTSTQGKRTHPTIIDDESLEKFHRRIKELLTLTAQNAPPRILHFSPEAEEIFSEFQRDIENKIIEDRSNHGALQGILSKIPENVVRLATLTHFFCEFEGDEISDGMLKHTISLVKYYYDQVANILILGMEQGENYANILYHWLLHGPINERGIQTIIAKTHVRRYAPYQLRDGTRLDKSLKILEERGQISITSHRNPNGSMAKMIHIYRN